MADVPAVKRPLRWRRRLAESGLAGLLVLSLWVANGEGLPLVWIVAVVVVAVGWESWVSGAIRDAVVSDIDPVEHPVAADVRETVADLATRMDIPTPRVAVVDRPWAGVTVLEDDGPLLVASRDAVDGLERDALRGVVAHELAHLALGHLDRLDVRDAITHVIGLAACWVVFLQYVPTNVALLGGGIYLTAGVYRNHGAMILLYLLGSVGAILVPMALVADADRCEELAADDLAAAHAGRVAYGRGLAHVTAARPGGVGGMGGAEMSGDGVGGATPSDGRRGPFTRLTARHPTLERRLDRLDVDREGLESAA